MFFTQEQIDEIIQRIAIRGIKDSQLDILSSVNIDNADEFVVLHNGSNMRMNLKDFMNAIPTADVDSKLVNYYKKSETYGKGSLYNRTELDTKLANKVTVDGNKVLSDVNFSNDYKNKVDGIETGANKTVVDNELSNSSTNPVENRVVTGALSALEEGIDNLNVKISGTNVTTTTKDIYPSDTINYIPTNPDITVTTLGESSSPSFMAKVIVMKAGQTVQYSAGDIYILRDPLNNGIVQGAVIEKVSNPYTSEGACTLILFKYSGGIIPGSYSITSGQIGIEDKLVELDKRVTALEASVPTETPTNVHPVLSYDNERRAVRDS